MRLFQKEFFWIGFANCVLAVGLFITAALRYRMTMTYSAKVNDLVSLRRKSRKTSQSRSPHAEPQTPDEPSDPPPVTAPNEPTYLLLPRFRTAGHVVAFVTLFILGVEIAIIVLIAMM